MEPEDTVVSQNSDDVGQNSKTKRPETGRARNRAQKETSKSRSKDSDFPVVGVGASAGGLEAFTELLKALPQDPGMAFVFIPHLDPGHKSAMAEVLSRSTQMKVVEAQHGTRVQMDHVYVIPPNTEMTVSERILFLRPREQGLSYLPVDRFLRSLAADLHRHSVGIVLSGTARDGTLGLAAIKSEGGITFAQDPSTAKYDGMPNSAISSGSVDVVLPPDGIAQELSRIRDYFVQRGDGLPGDDEHRTYLQQIFRLLKRANRVDFTDYKSGTIRRRLQRRMALQHIGSIRDYLTLLRRNPGELDQLYQDLLINVTSFFRDPRAFETLGEMVYPTLVKDRAPSDPIRIWVPGCSTGEEAYSHAMAILEYIRTVRTEVTIQIFGTDISEKAIRHARIGIFKESIAADVTPERLRRFFNKVESGYQVSKQIRDLCIFAVQNVFDDPPFSHMDLLSCRNVLIYLGPNLQQRIVPIFHYALKPKGFLIVGTAEGMIGSTPENLFEVVDQSCKIYRKRLVRSPIVFGNTRKYVETMPGPLGEDLESAHARRQETRQGIPMDLNREADRYLLSRYAPASVLVSDSLEILQTRGTAGQYLQVPSGKATLNLLKMARPGLLFELQKGLEEARTKGTPVRRENVQVETSDGSRTCNLEIRPLQSPLQPHHGFLILFADNDSRRLETEEHVHQLVLPVSEEDGGAQAVQLKQELAATKEYLQSIIESLEASNEELQSANEEIQSGNEELQSTNEELQTSKEELESANEELNTVNDEMRGRNRELTELNNDLLNVLASVKFAIVLLSADLTIRRFTPQAEKILGLSSIDVGRSISKVRMSVPVEALESTLLEAMHEVRIYDQEMEFGKRKYQVRITPYRTMENKIDGVVLAINLQSRTTWLAEKAPKKTKSGKRKN